MRMSDISVEYVIAVAVRAGLGLIFGILMGLLALIALFWALPATYTPPMWMLVTAAAVGCVVSGFISYYKPETALRIRLKTLLVVFIGAYIGAWFGFLWAEVFYPEGVRNVRLIGVGGVRSPAVMIFILWSAVGSALAGAVYYAFRAWRYHEV